MVKELFSGSAPAVICPMKQDGSVDIEAFDRLIVHLIDEGVSALVINGTTGEASTLTSAEKSELVKHAVQIADHRVPVIAGAGSNNTQLAIEAAKQAKEAGADGLLLVTPYYNKTSQAGLKAHFEAIVDAVQLPAILYTVPGRTGMNILPETVEALAKHPYIVGIKDATGSMAYTIEVIRRTQGLDFSVYSGEDRLTLPIIACGGRGVISVTSNIYPAGMEAIARNSLDGNYDEARKTMLALDAFIQLMFADVNPIPVKAAMAKAGYGANMVRLPLVPTSDALQEKISQAMDELSQKGY